jgi:ribonuclease D
VTLDKTSNFSPINTADGLNRLANVLRGESIVAVDTESNSLFAYRERVCLIQFSTLQDDYLVDPLALDDLSVLGPVFAEKRIEKVFHAAEYDLLCLNRDFGFECTNLFDTMLAARILGRNEIGLGSMLGAEFGVALDKRHQRANWGERPLPSRLLEYARMDTHYLIPLRQLLKAELVEHNLLPLAQEDFKHICNIPADNNGRTAPENRTADCWRVSGAHDLSPQRAAVLQELCHYRDQTAQAMDRPLFKVINDQTLLAIAAELPQNLDDLRNLPGMSPMQIRRHGHQLLRAVNRGLSSSPIYPPRTPRPDERYLARLDSLRNWRKEKARQLRTTSDVVLPRDLMFSLAESGPLSKAELARALDDFPWRLEHFGAEILNAISAS